MPPCVVAFDGERTRVTEQRTAIVTGGARGIGAAIATRLAHDGCAVGVIDLNESD
ncbi:MAG: SDR family NAD(P)-dependent oxidoreductase, partial [Leifsonia sp.]